MRSVRKLTRYTCWLRSKAGEAVNCLEEIGVAERGILQEPEAAIIEQLTAYLLD